MDSETCCCDNSSRWLEIGTISDGYASDSCDSVDGDLGRPHCGQPRSESNLAGKRVDKMNKVVERLARLDVGTAKSSNLSQLTDDQALSCVSISLWTFLSADLRATLDAEDITRWLLSADQALVAASWQCESVLTVSSLVLLNMIARRLLEQNSRLAEACFGFRLRSVSDFKALVLVCLYVTCTYAGQEITYPSWPFLSIDEGTFWHFTVRAALAVSGDLLRVNSHADVYAHELQLLAEVTHRQQLSECRATCKKVPVRLSVGELLLEDFVRSVTEGTL